MKRYGILLVFAVLFLGFITPNIAEAFQKCPDGLTIKNSSNLTPKICHFFNKEEHQASCLIFQERKETLTLPCQKATSRDCLITKIFQAPGLIETITTKILLEGDQIKNCRYEAVNSESEDYVKLKPLK